MSVVPSLKLRKQLHQSGVEMLQKCGMQFQFAYIQGIRRSPNAFIVAGHATDKAVNADLDHKIIHGDLEKESVILDIARDSVEKYPHKETIEPDPEDKGKTNKVIIGETKDKAVRFVRGHHKEIAPTIQPYQTARKFTINLDEFLLERAKHLLKQAAMEELSYARRVLELQAKYLQEAGEEGLDFVGEQDIVEKYFRPAESDHEWDIAISGEVEYLAIRDSKTSGKSPAADVVHNSDQLTAYAMASTVFDGRLPDQVMLDYMIDLKGGVKTMTVTSKRTLEDVDIYLNRLATAVATIRSGMFTPTQQTNWWCAEKWCAYTAKCPYFRKPQTTIKIPKNLTGTIQASLVQINSRKAKK